MVRGFQEGLSQWRARQGQVCGDVLENVPQVIFSFLFDVHKDQWHIEKKHSAELTGTPNSAFYAHIYGVKLYTADKGSCEKRSFYGKADYKGGGR